MSEELIEAAIKKDPLAFLKKEYEGILKLKKEIGLDYKNHIAELILTRRDFAKNNTQISLLILSGILLTSFFNEVEIYYLLAWRTAIILAVAGFILNLIYWQWKTDSDLNGLSNALRKQNSFLEKQLEDTATLMQNIDSEGFTDEKKREFIKIYSRSVSTESSSEYDNFLEISNFLTISSLILGFASLQTFIQVKGEVLLIVTLICTYLISFYGQKIMPVLMKKIVNIKKMKTYIFLTKEGRAQDVEGKEVESLQVLGFGSGTDEASAFENFRAENSYLQEYNFNDTTALELADSKEHYFSLNN